MSSQASLYLGDETYRRPVYESTLETSYECPATVEESERLDPEYLSCWCNSRLKRWFDVGLSLPALVLASPLLIGVAIAIKVTSRGPVFFRQPRVGRNQLPFIILKFRTMAHCSQHTGPSVTRHGDPRLTPLGGFLRRSKLDELPQLFNVLRGDMSLVGPRPKLAQHEKMFMACRPGITGAATIMFCDEERMLAHIPESLVEQHALSVFNPIKVRLDQEYQRKASFATDVRILMRTVLRTGRDTLVVELVPRSVGRFSEQVQTQDEAQGFAGFPASGPLAD